MAIAASRLLPLAMVILGGLSAQVAHCADTPKIGDRFLISSPKQGAFWIKLDRASTGTLTACALKPGTDPQASAPDGVTIPPGGDNKDTASQNFVLQAPWHSQYVWNLTLTRRVGDASQTVQFTLTGHLTGAPTLSNQILTTTGDCTFVPANYDGKSAFLTINHF